MSLNIVCTSKPVDGLLYYSYEYCCQLNAVGIDARLIIVCHRDFDRQDYIDAITQKYIHCNNLIFDKFIPSPNDVTLIMGRSMMSMSWQSFKSYSIGQQVTLKLLFSCNLISVYSENHPIDYPKAVDFYRPKNIIDLCDTDVYPNGVGNHFEKIINFEIYRPFITNIQFEHLFLGTNDKYYSTVEKALAKYPNYGILTYNSAYINQNYNNVFAPVNNLLGIFNTYVYTKATFDPAPRLFQECKYFGKGVIYHRDKHIVDGGSVYWNRGLKKIDVTPIVEAFEILKGKI